MIPAAINAVRARLQGVHVLGPGSITPNYYDNIVADLNAELTPYLGKRDLQSVLLGVRVPSHVGSITGYLYRMGNAVLQPLNLILAEDIYPTLPLRFESYGSEMWSPAAPLVISLHQFFRDKSFVQLRKYFHIRSLLMERDTRIDDIEINRIKGTLSEPRRFRIIELLAEPDDSGQIGHIVARQFEAGYALAIRGLGYEYVAANIKEDAAQNFEGQKDLIRIGDRRT